MRRLVATFILAILITLPARSQAPDPSSLMPADAPETIRTAYNDAVNLLNAGNGGAALDKLREVIRVLPNFFPGHLACADALEQAGQMPDSLAEIEIAARLSPDNESVLHHLGRAYQLCGRRDDSIRTLERYLWLYPDASNASNIKNVVAQMKSENQRRDIFADSRGLDNYLEEALAVTAGRWSASRMPIPVYINNGTGVRAFTSYFPVLLKQAFAEWAQSSQDKVSFKLVDNPASSLIECFWSSDARELSSPIEAGEAENYTGAGKLESSKITLLTTAFYSQPQSFKGVCLHEIGHALGLQGHSSDPADIMFMFSKKNDGRANTLSERDKKTLVMLYSISETDLARHGHSSGGSQPFLHDGTSTNEANINQNQGVDAFKAGRYNEALRSFQEAVRLSPSTPAFNMNLANTYVQIAGQELKSKNYVNFQKHMELSAKYAVIGKHPEMAASAYSVLAKFAHSLKNENDAFMYEQESQRLKQQKAP